MLITLSFISQLETETKGSSVGEPTRQKGEVFSDC